MKGRGIQLGDCKDGIVAWAVEVWGGDGSGLRIYLDAESNTLEFSLIFTREEAFQKGVLANCYLACPGYNPKAVNLKKLDAEDTVMLWGGILEKSNLVKFCKSVLSLAELDGAQ